MVQHPGAEQAVKQRLHQRGTKKSLALLTLKLEVERLSKRLADFNELGQVSPLEHRAGLAGVGSQKPRQILWGAQGGAVQQAALKVFTKSDLVLLESSL